jgi:hypothetical protein
VAAAQPEDEEAIRLDQAGKDAIRFAYVVTDDDRRFQSVVRPRCEYQPS